MATELSSADTYIVVLPRITSATFSPNPANINASLLLSVSVTEVTVTQEPFNHYSGELFAGEV